MRESTCVCVCVCARARKCVCARVRACVRTYVRVDGCMGARMCVCVFVCFHRFQNQQKNSHSSVCELEIYTDVVCCDHH